jgi:hypothetical protein
MRENTAVKIVNYLGQWVRTEEPCLSDLNTRIEHEQGYQLIPYT